MTEATKRKDLDRDYFLHPARAFRTPMDVMTDPDMTVQEKRAVLASWASDACAVEAAPDLGHPRLASVVRFDDIMDALKQLNGDVASISEYGKFLDRAALEAPVPKRSGKPIDPRLGQSHRQTCGGWPVLAKVLSFRSMESCHGAS